MEKKVWNKYRVINKNDAWCEIWDILLLENNDWSDCPIFINLNTNKNACTYRYNLEPYIPFTLPTYWYIEDDWSELAKKCMKRISDRAWWGAWSWRWVWYDWVESYNWYHWTDRLGNIGNNTTKITLEQLWEHIQGEKQEKDIPSVTGNGTITVIQEHPQRVIDLADEERRLQNKPVSMYNDYWFVWFDWDDSRQWKLARSQAYRKDYTLLQERVDKNKKWCIEKVTHNINPRKWMPIYTPFTLTPIKKMSKLTERKNKKFFTERREDETNKLIDEAKEIADWYNATMVRARDAESKINILIWDIETAFELNNIEEYKKYMEELQAVLKFYEWNQDAQVLSKLWIKKKKEVEKYDPSL